MRNVDTSLLREGIGQALSLTSIRVEEQVLYGCGYMHRPFESRARSSGENVFVRSSWGCAMMSMKAEVM